MLKNIPNSLTTLRLVCALLSLNTVSGRLLFYTPLILLLPLQIIGAWVVWLLLARDFFVDSLKAYYARKGHPLPPLISNKFKLVMQTVLVVLMLLHLHTPLSEGIARGIEAFSALTVGFSLWSAFSYLQYAFPKANDAE